MGLNEILGEDCAHGVSLGMTRVRERECDIERRRERRVSGTVCDGRG